MVNYTAPPTPPVVFKASSPATTATQSDLVALASVLAIAVGILTVAVVVLFFKISNMSQSRKSLSVVEPVEPVTSGQAVKPSHSLAVI